MKIKKKFKIVEETIKTLDNFKSMGVDVKEELLKDISIKN